MARGGTPSAFDRVYGARLGYGAIKLVLEKKWGQMLTLRGTEIKSMSLEDGVKELKTVTCLLYTSPSPRDGLLSRMPSSA